MNVDRSALLAVEVKGDFEFDAADNEDESGPKGGEKDESTEVDPSASSSDEVIKPFSLKNIDIAVPKGT